MEAFAHYLLGLSAYHNRLFISQPTQATLLVWSNRISLPVPTGLTLLYRLDASETETRLGPILIAQLPASIPLLTIGYDQTFDSLIVDNSSMPLSEAARILATRMGLQLGKRRPKPANDPARITDPFHQWSRDTFDGRTVVKTDIDLLILDSDGQRIQRIVEIKRSQKHPVGQWVPYINEQASNDSNNYYLLMALSRALQVPMTTIHHAEMDALASLRADSLIDSFHYLPGPVLPNRTALEQFARRHPRTTQSVADLLRLR